MPARASVFVCALVLAACSAGTSPSISAESSAASVEPTDSVEPTSSAGAKLETDYETADAAPPGSIDIAMTCCPKFIPKKATAKAGTVVFFLHNDIGTLSAPHNFMIGESLGAPPLAASPTLSPRQSLAFTVFDLPAGTYTYWCTVPSPDGKSHASYGMVGTLTVTS